MGKKARLKRQRQEGDEPLTTVNNTDDPRFLAGIDLLRRTGMRSFELRYSDDNEPVVWIAVGEWSVDEHGRPRPNGTRTLYDSASAIDPLGAVTRLCDTVVDGGVCAHCGRPGGVTDHWESDMPLATLVCWYVYDPETQTYRRSCEGDTP